MVVFNYRCHQYVAGANEAIENPCEVCDGFAVLHHDRRHCVSRFVVQLSVAGVPNCEQWAHHRKQKA
jgi:hypothetical protein